MGEKDQDVMVVEGEGFEGGFKAKMRMMDKDDPNEVRSTIYACTDWRELVALANERGEELGDREAATAALLLGGLAAMLPEVSRGTLVPAAERPVLAATLRKLLAYCGSGARKLKVRSISEAVHAAVSFGLDDPNAIQRLMLAAEAQGERFRADELLKLLYAAAFQLRARLRPALTFWLLGASERRMTYFKAEEVSRMSAVLGLYPPEEPPSQVWLLNFYSCCKQHLDKMDGDGLAGALAIAVMGKQAGVPAYSTLVRGLMARLQGVMEELDGTCLVAALCAVSALKPLESGPWVTACLEQIRHLAWEEPGLTQEQQVAVLQALAVMRHHPGEDWLDEFLAASTPCISKYTARESAIVLSCLSRMSHSPSKEVWTALLAAIGGKFAEYPGPGLLHVATSLSQTPTKPPAKWTALFLSRLGESELAELTQDELVLLIRALSSWARPSAEVLERLTSAAAAGKLPQKQLDSVADDLVQMGGDREAVLKAMGVRGQGKATKSAAAPAKP